MRFAVVLSLVASVASGAMALSAPSARTVAVTGATGKLGRRAVERLVLGGCAVRCLVRHDPGPDTVASDAADATGAEVAAWLEGLGATLVRGDVTDAACVRGIVDGCDAVLALHGATRRSSFGDLLGDATRDPGHAKNVNYEAVKHILAACEAGGCGRVVRVTGKGETPWSVFSVLINLLGSMAKAWNYEGENLLRASRVDYTIVRPGIMSPGATLEPASLALADNGGDLKVSPIPHAAIADLCVQSLDAPGRVAKG